MFPELCQSCRQEGMTACAFWVSVQIVLQYADRLAARASEDYQYNRIGQVTHDLISEARREAMERGCPNADYDPPYAGKS